jgi:microcystin-dependent protein
MPVYLWSQTASANATADPTINFAEGQAPSSVNDSARALMAAAAKYRDDMSGANLATGGTSTAYTVTSNQGFDTLAHLVAQHLTIYPHATNGASPTLNVDGLGACPIITDAAGTIVPTGTLIAGTPYELVLDGSNRFRLKNFYQLPFTVPVGATIDYFGTTAPNSNFVFPFGQAISRTTYAALFALLGTTFGTGDGSTTFNIPDLRGRVIAGKDDMGGSAASRIGSVVTDSGTIVGANLGSAGGSSTHVLISTEMPTHSHGVTDPGHTHSLSPSPANVFTTGSGSDSTGSGKLLASASVGSATTGISINTAGGSVAHAILQPTIVANKLLRII